MTTLTVKKITGIRWIDKGREWTYNRAGAMYGIVDVERGVVWSTDMRGEPLSPHYWTRKMDAAEVLRDVAETTSVDQWIEDCAGQWIEFVPGSI